MSVPHPYDKREKPPALRLDVKISNAAGGNPIPFLGKLDTGAAITKVPEILRAGLEPLSPMGEVTITYGDDSSRKYLTYLTRIYLNGFELDAEVYFRRADYILIGRNVLNQLKFCADGMNEVFAFESPD
jgi:hypothetical protein